MKNVVELKEIYTSIKETENNKDEKYVCVAGDICGKNWQIYLEEQSKSSIIDNHTKYKEALFALADAASYMDYVEKLYCSANEKSEGFSFSLTPFIMVKENTVNVINPNDADGAIVEITDKTEVLRDYVALWFSWDRTDIWRTQMFYLSIEDLHELAMRYNIDTFKNITFDELYKLVHDKVNIDDNVFYTSEYNPNAEEFYNKEAKEIEKTR